MPTAECVARTSHPPLSGAAITLPPITKDREDPGRLPVIYRPNPERCDFSGIRVHLEDEGMGRLAKEPPINVSPVIHWGHGCGDC